MWLGRGSKGEVRRDGHGEPGHAGPYQVWGKLAFHSKSHGKPLQGSKQGDDSLWLMF